MELPLRRPHRPGDRGFTLVAAALFSLVLVGAVGLAIDTGQWYRFRGAAQACADAAALDAALELDGTQVGLARARAVAAQGRSRWEWNSTDLDRFQTEFAEHAVGPWDARPASAERVRFVRVTATTRARMLFLSAVAGPPQRTVEAQAVAGQVLREEFSGGLFPFAPLSHDPEAEAQGLTPGRLYTLRWADHPRAGDNVCDGDEEPRWIALGQAAGNGYFAQDRPDAVRASIESDALSEPLRIGSLLRLTSASRQAQRDSLIQRVLQDSDPSAASYAEYVARGLGNGRRLVVAPLRSLTASGQARVAAFAAFFLLPASRYEPGDDRPFCAEFVGAHVQGARQRGAAKAGAFLARLIH